MTPIRNTAPLLIAAMLMGSANPHSGPYASHGLVT